MTQQTEGIWGHSGETGNREYVIFSVDRPNLDYVTLTSRRHSVLVFCAQNDIGHKLVFGSYKGHAEVSFVVNRDNFTRILAAGLVDDQDCVLVLGACDARDRRPAVLRGIATRQERYNLGAAPAAAWLTWCQQCGLFQEIDATFLKQFDGWTYDPTQRRFFACI